MALIVQKYGGAVMSNVEKIRNVAKSIAELHAAGNQVVAVVSAMGNTTDDLVRLAYSVAQEPTKREMDMLLSVGERITMSLMAMAIEDTGLAKAVSFTGSQVGIITDTRHTEARIVEIRNTRIKEALEEGKVVVVAGFQGVSLDKEITTLGRGGSDTTAVALAAALGADRCDLIKEVPGIFTSDPTIIPEAVPIPEMDYTAAAGMSLGGARILKDSCLALARRYGIELRVGNNHFSTKVKDIAAEPFFNVSVRSGYNMYSNIDIDYADAPEDVVEVSQIGDKRAVFILKQKFPDRNALGKHTPIAEDISKLTAVGDGVEGIFDIITRDEKAGEIYYSYFFNREARIYFSTMEPTQVLKDIHEKLLKIVEYRRESDAGQR